MTYTVTITLRNRRTNGPTISVSTVLCGADADGLGSAADLDVIAVALVPDYDADMAELDSENLRRRWAGITYNPLPVD